MPNKMRNRLIKLFRGATINCEKEIRCINCEYNRKKECKIERKVDCLLANGVIVPPCKVGDIVHKVANDKRVKIPYECKVVGFWISEDENCNSAHLVRYVNGVFDCSFSVPFTNFGKTVFLTREEAEKALAERSGE